MTSPVSAKHGFHRKRTTKEILGHFARTSVTRDANAKLRELAVARALASASRTVPLFSRKTGELSCASCPTGEDSTVLDGVLPRTFIGLPAGYPSPKQT